ncbi:hypothetical protein KPY62_12330 [Psychrobacter sp. TAE2020]|uniref:hypothetical protein n=1 Tax=Psychrobacter sp. TAE2020 TaxID=2846762 RepID=UPI001C121A99|nr:hypothetical protein [Psychrobacter sp. TAE2020]MBU5617862.1 hypothetical protein [Psychrobacter sp. TAE2020]
MSIKKWLVILPMMLGSISAMAMVGEVAGDTTCSTVSLINKKLLKKTPCSFAGAIGASLVYSVQQLDFTTDSHENFSTVNNATFRFGDDAEMFDLEETISLNDKPAEVIKLDSRTLKRLKQAEMDRIYKRKNPDFSNVLHCFKPIKNSTAFCVPYGLIYGMS